MVGRDKFGVFPLKGKLLNVREASHRHVPSSSPPQKALLKKIKKKSRHARVFIDNNAPRTNVGADSVCRSALRCLAPACVPLLLKKHSSQNKSGHARVSMDNNAPRTSAMTVTVLRLCTECRHVRDNVEFSAIKTILGLQHGSTYHKKAGAGKGDRSLKALRYGKVMLMTDQDHDGSHIKVCPSVSLRAAWHAIYAARARAHARTHTHTHAPRRHARVRMLCTHKCTRANARRLRAGAWADGARGWREQGLFFNMMHHFWPELLHRNDFICEFVTPIVKCFRTGGRPTIPTCACYQFYIPTYRLHKQDLLPTTHAIPAIRPVTLH